MEYTPLAERLRPKSLDEFIGQEHLTGIFKQALESGLIPSIILWGPPGVGKTTLAGILAKGLKRPFYTLSAVNAGVKEVREIISKVEQGGLFGTGSAIVFIDEIHRFNKSQQDSLLGAVERGTITLIGATTENPSFEVNSALLSRCQVYVLKPLNTNHLKQLIERAINTDSLIKSKGIAVRETKALMQLSGGDARRLLNVEETLRW